MSKRPRPARSNKRPRPRSTAAARPAAPIRQAPAVATAEAAPALAATEPRPAPTRPQPRTASRPSGLLAQKAANEYVYVARDLRRVAVFAVSIAAVLLVVWVLVDLLGVIAV
jgi:hypothetical protein